MKKTLFITSVAVAGLLAFHALTATYQSQTFLKGSSVTVVQAASATAQNVGTGSTASTVTWTNKQGQVIVAGTNSIGQTYGGWDQPVNVFSDANGNVVAGSFSYTLVSGPGSLGAPTTTNTLTFTLQRSANGTDWDAAVPFSFTSVSPLVGTAQVTNLPAWFLTGATQIRVGAISFATNSFTATNILTHLGFNGFAP